MKPIKVLIVDDDPAVRAFSATTLRSHGFEVAEATGGREALAWCKTRPVDVIVLDNSMPDMPGIDVARSLREDPTTADLPIMMLSGLSSDEDQWDGWRAGVDVYVTKPFEGDELVTHIERLVRVRSRSA
ncbi:MAG: response regulator [Actinomycetota bacterium]